MSAGRAVPLVVAVAALAVSGWASLRSWNAQRVAEEAFFQWTGEKNSRYADQKERETRSKEFEAQMDRLQNRVAELEASARDREKELLAVRADLERARRGAEEQARRVQSLEAHLPPAIVVDPPPIRGGDSPKREADGEEVIGGPPPPMQVVPDPKVKPPAEKAPAPDLGPTAVSDARQLKKLVDGLNTLLAGVGGEETWKVASASAAEDDRLVTVVLEARGTGGTVTKSFKAAEARFVLQGASGTLSIKLKEGSVTYPGNRTVPFPEGSYTVLLVVETAPFRAAGHPLVIIQ